MSALNENSSKEGFFRAFGPKNLRTLLEKLPFATIVIDSEERVLYINAAGERLYECTFATVVNKPVSRMMFLSNPNIISEAVGRVFRRETMVNLEWQEEQYYEGRVFWRQGTIFSLPDENGNVACAVMNIVDITEQVRTQKKLRKSLEHYRMLFESAPDAMLILREGQIMGANPACEKIMGYKEEELNGKYLWELSPAFQPSCLPSREVAEEKIRKALKGEHQFFEWKYRSKEGKFITTGVSLALISNPHVPQTVPLLQAVIQEAKKS